MDKAKATYIWLYEINYIDTYNKDIPYAPERRSGFVPASTMSDAVKKLEEYYGEAGLDNIFRLEAINEGECLEFDFFNLEKCGYCVQKEENNDLR